MLVFMIMYAFRGQIKLRLANINPFYFVYSAVGSISHGNANLYFIHAMYRCTVRVLMKHRNGAYLNQ